MPNIALIIQARKGSTRLPNKVVMPFFENKSVLEILIDKLKTNFDYPVLLATTTNGEDDELIDIAKSNQINYYRGSAENVLDRFIQCANHYNVETCIRICADNPFLDIDFLKDIIKNHLTESSDYTSYCKADATPVIKTHYGVFAEVVELSALQKAKTLTNDALYTEHVTNYVYGNPSIFKIKLVLIPIYLENKNIRLTLDTQEDWNTLKNIYNTCYSTNKDFKTNDVVELIKNNESILASMYIQISRFTK